jgi:acylphosphatase
MAERREVHYSGRVQGVGFRFTAREVASHYAVTGYVQNLSDGRVRLVCEGEPAELDKFLRDLQFRMEGKIDNVTFDHQLASGEFSGFTIR